MVLAGGLMLLLAGAVQAAPAAPAPPAQHWYDQARNWLGGLWPRSASDWLERIGPALREQNYQGTLVMVTGDRMDTLGVFHAFAAGHERMRLVTLSGNHREVIRDNDLVMVIGASHAPVGYDADGAGRANPGERFAGAGKLDTYRATLGARARVAGRDAQIVELAARDSWRYGFRLWLDRQTALPLRIALIGDAGRPLEQMAFTEIQVGQAPAEADLRPSTNDGLQRVQSLASDQPVDPGWRIDDPPPGFALRGARRLGQAVQLLYSDGLSSVSVYIEPMPRGQQGESAMQRGAVNAHSRWGDGRRVVAIGKVPAATVERFVLGARIGARAASPVRDR